MPASTTRKGHRAVAKVSAVIEPPHQRLRRRVAAPRGTRHDDRGSLRRGRGGGGIGTAARQQARHYGVAALRAGEHNDWWPLCCGRGSSGIGTATRQGARQHWVAALRACECDNWWSLRYGGCGGNIGEYNDIGSLRCGRGRIGIGADARQGAQQHGVAALCAGKYDD